MNKPTEEKLLEVLVEIRNWMRVATRDSIRTSLERALPDPKSRAAYQMFDGESSIEQVRVACKMSPNAVVALASRCTSLGLMEVTPDKRRVRLFDLRDFDLPTAVETAKPRSRE